jgi:chromosome segregation ATPase
VAPDITVALSAPGSRAPSARVKRPASAARTPPRAKARDLGRELEAATAAQARLAAERDALLAERDELRLERDALIVERDGMRRRHTRARKKVTELSGQLKALEASANAGLSEAQHMLEAQRAETSGLRTALESREAGSGDDGRLARELETVVAERDRLAEQARATRPAAIPVRRPLPARSRRRAPVWVARILVLIALCGVLLTLALVSHLA